MDTIYGRFEWDEAKRQANLLKHGLDFRDAGVVFDAVHKLTFQTFRSGETRYVDIAIIELNSVFVALVYVQRGERIRIISYRLASRRERKRFDLSGQSDKLGTGLA